MTCQDTSLPDRACLIYFVLKHLSPLRPHHYNVEYCPTDDAYDKEQSGAGVIVNDDDEDDNAEEEDDDGKEKRHSNRTRTIGIPHAEVDQASQRHALG